MHCSLHPLCNSSDAGTFWFTVLHPNSNPSKLVLCYFQLFILAVLEGEKCQNCSKISASPCLLREATVQWGNSHSNTAYSVAVPLWPQQCRETGRVGRSSISLQVFIFFKTAESIGGLVFCYVHSSDGIYQSISGLDCPSCLTEPYTDRPT